MRMFFTPTETGNHAGARLAICGISTLIEPIEFQPDDAPLRRESGNKFSEELV